MNQAAIILAAGQGSRMKSDLPKVAHHAAGAPMVEWVVRAAVDSGVSRVILVVGHQQEVVRDLFDGSVYPIEYAVQAQQLGTGHAALMTETALAGFDGDVFVLVGDGPLLRADVLRKVHQRHVDSGAAATLATAVIPDPTGYGRVIRDDDGAFVGIVEQKDATPDQLRVTEVNPSIYCFRAAALWDALHRITPSPATGELYITDVPALLMQDGDLVEVVPVADAHDALSVNTPEQLADVDAILRARLNQSAAAQSGTDA